MDIIKSLQWRYATKKFSTKKIIPESQILKLTQAFNLTATSYGLQPLKLIVVQDKALQSVLVTHSMGQQQIEQASHVLVFCIEKTINKHYIENYFNLVKQVRDTPDSILEPFKIFLIDDFNKKTSKTIKTWATKQAYLAMGNLLTVCALLQIDACPMEGFNPKGYSKVLRLNKKQLQAVLVMPIGYRASDDYMAPLKKVRKAASETVIRI